MRAGVRAPAALPVEIAALLSAHQRAAWDALPAMERAHLARVGRTLLEAGHTAPDLLVAAVFHDVGKHTGRGGVRLLHRVARVLMDRFAPGQIARLRASSAAPALLYPLWLSVHHARLGAAHAGELGCSPRVCWLIAHHEDTPPVQDAGLAALQWADNRS